GTTSSASVDPVARVAELCREEELWLHVDAAYGGAMGVLPEGRWALEGVELADSVVVNPHKWLFVPLDFSTLYMRRPEALRAVFSLVPEYLRGDATASTWRGDTNDANDASGPDGRGAAVDYMDYGIQLGRRFRALKAWMVLRAFGGDGIAARIREHCRLAAALGARVTAEPDFELAAPVAMSVVCFRFVPGGRSAAELDALNARIVAEVNATGRGYLTHSRLGERTVMRVGFGNIATTEAHLELVWGEIVAAAGRVGGDR
ncbi:MAG: amino acid decarboxylase, partial [Gemmatimonadetes bacterium]|nr:amino acid decarboxylase [Gemmatimonadota bacterium]